MKDRVVILSSFKHAEARAVAERLPSGRTVFVDDELFLRKDRFSLRLDGKAKFLLQWLVLGKVELSTSNVLSVFFRPTYRRPLSGGGRLDVVLLEADPLLDEKYHQFARAEAEAALYGALLPSEARWVNHPLSDLGADYKVQQLVQAHRIGLAVPKSLISHDANELSAFWHEHSGAVICKAISSRPNLLLPETAMTRQVAESDLQHLAESGTSMTLFQELIPAALDLRVTIVGDETFAVAIHSQDGVSPLDWRIDQTVKMESFELDPTVVNQLQQLRRQLGLEYAAADLRITPEGVPVFLEMNAQGAYLFVEKIVGIPITKVLADLLLSPRTPVVADRRVAS